MANGTLIAVPPNVDSPQALRLFLTRLIEKLDIAFGYRGNTSFVTQNDIASLASSDTLQKSIQELTQTGQSIFDQSKEYTDEEIEAVNETIENLSFTNNPEQAPVSDSSVAPLTMLGSYDQPQQQQLANDVIAIQDKVNEILVALRAAEILDV